MSKAKLKYVFNNFHILFSLNKRNYTDWFIDLLGLFLQGVGIALIQTWFILKVFPALLPSYQSSVSIHPIIQFVISFILIDYIYYWNHRMLHSNFFWRLHFLHHSTQSVDWLTTSRNHLFTPLVICYLWIHSFFAFILTDYRFYLVGVICTYTLDIWRHSKFSSNHAQIFQKLEGIFITPRLHHEHHSKTNCESFFGANFSWWDRLHGTKKDISNSVLAPCNNLVSLKDLVLFPKHKKAGSEI